MKRLMISAFVATLGTLAVDGSAIAQGPNRYVASQASSGISADAIPLLQMELQSTLDSMPRVEGQQPAIKVSLAYDEAARRLVVDLGTGGLPAFNGVEWEEQAQILMNVVSDVLGDEVGVSEIRFEFDGKGLEELRPDPEEVGLSQRQSLRTPRVSADSTPVVVVDGGHGVYRNYKFNDWRAQRDPLNGITEDYLTPELARTLKTYLSADSGISAVLTRSDFVNLHPEANVEEWKMGARYYLKTMLPDRKDIWNSLPNATHYLRERDEDLRSRPKYANHLEADYLIHLHADATDSVAVRGTRVYVQPGRPVDEALGNSILCSMKELIRADPDYSEWKVAAAPMQADKGENRLAEMPSVIVETGFYSNADDAAALQRSAFRVRAMKGVEKGLRMYRNGTGCGEFKITSAPPVSGGHSVDIPFEVKYTGMPAYPMYLRTKIVTCPEGYSCSQYSSQYPWAEDVHGTLQSKARCTAFPQIPGSVIVVDRYLEDADGVKTPMFRSSITCN